MCLRRPDTPTEVPQARSWSGFAQTCATVGLANRRLFQRPPVAAVPPSNDVHKLFHYRVYQIDPLAPDRKRWVDVVPGASDPIPVGSACVLSNIPFLERDRRLTDSAGRQIDSENSSRKIREFELLSG